MNYDPADEYQKYIDAMFFDEEEYERQEALKDEIADREVDERLLNEK